MLSFVCIHPWHIIILGIVWAKTCCRHHIGIMFHWQGVSDLWPCGAATQQHTDGLSLPLITVYRFELAAQIHQLCNEAVPVSSSACWSLSLWNKVPVDVLEEGFYSAWKEIMTQFIFIVTKRTFVVFENICQHVKADIWYIYVILISSMLIHFSVHCILVTEIIKSHVWYVVPQHVSPETEHLNLSENIIIWHFQSHKAHQMSSFCRQGSLSVTRIFQ